MEKQTRKITVEQLLYFLIFGIALGLRLLRLGGTALSDFEAGWAIQSWHAVQGQTYQIGANPGYFSLTTLLFFIFGSSNYLARFWPAVAGSLIVLTPRSFRRWLGPGPALIMALGLALDPGMVALSRLAGGPMLAISAGVLFLGFLVSRKPVWAGVMGGLALISGAGIWMGLVGILITLGITRIAGVVPTTGQYSGNGELESPTPWSRKQIQAALIVGGVTGLLTATYFFRFPSGLGAWGSSFTNFLQGWFNPSDVPRMQPILAIVFYQPLALLAAVSATIRTRRDDNGTVRWLSIWVLVSLLFSLIYPGSQVYDSAWAILPLWALAAIEINHYLRIPKFPIIATSQAGIVFILLVLFWLITLNPIPGGFSWAVLISLPLLIIMTTALVGLGWSWSTSRSGFAWGICLSLSLFSLAAMIGVSQLRSNSPLELWVPPPGAVQVDLLTDTIQDLALIQNGRVDTIDIVSNVDRHSLQWVLRNFSDVDFVSVIGPDVLASIILTPVTSELDVAVLEDVNLAQSMAYRGQDFSWAVNPGWSGALPPQWWKWLTTREAPVKKENLILWARSDLFPEQIDLEQEDTALNPPENLGGIIK